MKSSKSAKLNRLDDMTIRRLVKAGVPGLYNDGGGLNLKITGPNTASWVFRYKTRYMGIGPYPVVGLAQARADVQEPRRLVTAGLDPLEHRAAARQRALVDKAKNVTFGYCAELWLQGKTKRCTPATVRSMEGRLRLHVYPHIAENFPVREIDTSLVLQVLEPIWGKIPKTAEAARIHLEEIFDLAKARTFRNIDSENPARWKGHLEHSGLPPTSAIHTVVHRKMLSHTEIPEFLVALRRLKDGYPAVRARCLEFMIHTTTRPGEAASARWSEIDLENRTWTIPAEKMKSRRPHITPLSDQAMRVVSEQREIALTPRRQRTALGKRVRAAIEAHPHYNDAWISVIARCSDAFVYHVRNEMKSPPPTLGEYIFEKHTIKRGVDHLPEKQLNNVLLPSIGYSHVNAHGFRASFSTWAGDETHYDDKLREFQLAHKVDNETAAAYNRGTGLEKRRRMVQDWSDACEGILPAKVVPLRRVGGPSGE